ncbi:hypothetical protein SADUNF_Sadunf09G0029700 [Salix dunnii]|uniref:Uncharacterized protein n=1 Tax=Salix dunnii TaxID=1413687 RepID=A0A835MQQ0_9ROSI|nr:hypothetical protein SADUNF_Sadunf09G0029700 [Salix dunnii]
MFWRPTFEYGLFLSSMEARDDGISPRRCQKLFHREEDFPYPDGSTANLSVAHLTETLRIEMEHLNLPSSYNHGFSGREL